MKKLLSITLALILALSLSVPAFAEVTVDGESKGPGEVSVDSAQYVSAKATGDDLTVTGNVTGNGEHNSVYAQRGGEINVGGTVTGNISWGGDAIFAMDDSTKVVVAGTVTEEAGGSAIKASDGATVEVGSVVEKNDGHAIKALSGANVIVHGDITEDGDDHAINAEGEATMVTVEGNITEKGDDSAIRAMDGATVIVFGNVEENNNGVSIACGNATIMVGGDVTKVGGGSAISANNGATVIVEGIVSGNTKKNVGRSGAADLYLGQLNGTIEADADLSKIHYLIGVAPEGSAALSAVKLVSDIVADGTIDGVNEKGYRYTSTANTTALNGKTITLKPADGKILTVSGFKDANVTYVPNDDGTVTFTLGESFTGGLQNLVLVLANKPGPTPGPDPDPSPVYYIVPADSITVVEFTAPEGVEEGLITMLESADHVGITVDSSLVGDGSVKVLKGDKELSAKDFSIYTHADGSIDVILSNTCLLALGSGSYDFTAIVNGLEIPFTVVVAK